MSAKPGDSQDAVASPAKSEEPKGTINPEPTGSTPAAVEDVPDPDEDDLDDLDDMLDEFSAAKIEDNKPAVPSGKPSIPSDPGRPKAKEEDGEGISDEEFAKQLQAGMADLLGELETSPDMQAQFEGMLKELGGAAALGEGAGEEQAAGSSKAGASSSKTAPAAVPTDESFQETIKKTMERMQASGDKATQAATEDDTEDFLAQMMKAMESGGLEGAGSEEDFSKMLLGMMEQLTNKEILYEPMKELDDKFPAWLEKNGKTVSKEDMERYTEQQKVVSEIVKKFEEKTYKDENAADREYIVERMQKMQAAGSPPPDLVGDMAAAQEAFGAPEEGCPQQ